MAVAAATSMPATKSTRTTLPPRSVAALRSLALRARLASNGSSPRPTVSCAVIRRLAIPARFQCQAPLNRARGFAPCRTISASPPPSPRHQPPQPHQIADDFGNSAVVLLRNFLVDLHRAVQRAGQWRVFDHRDAVGLGNFADFAGDQIDALGDADRRIHAALVA